MPNTYEVFFRTTDSNKFSADELGVKDNIVTLYEQGEVVASFPKEAIFGAWKVAK